MGPVGWAFVSNSYWNSISRELLLGSFVEIGVTVFLFFVPNKDFGAFGTL